MIDYRIQDKGEKVYITIPPELRDQISCLERDIGMVLGNLGLSKNYLIRYDRNGQPLNELRLDIEPQDTSVSIVAYRQKAENHPPVYMFHMSKGDEVSRTTDLRKVRELYDMLTKIGVPVTLEPDMNQIRSRIPDKYEKEITTELYDPEKSLVRGEIAFPSQ